MKARSVASFLLPLFLSTAPASAASAPPATFVPGQVLVKFKAGSAVTSRGAVLARRGHDLIRDLDVPDFALARVAVGQSVEAAVEAYQEDPTVEYAQPNYIYRSQAAPNDPSYGLLWGLKNTGQTITNAFTQPVGSPLPYDARFPGSNPGVAGSDVNAEAAWNAITDCSSVTVAVIDSGVNYNHEDLTTNMWSSPAYPKHGYNYVDGTDDPMDDNGHGTHVAGTIGAVGNNGIGVTGVCWKASIMAVKVLDSSGAGDTAHVIEGINFAIPNGAKVINMSLGGTNPFDRAYSEAVTRAQLADVVVVVAAGNAGLSTDTTDVWPCNFTTPNLICVAALDQKYGLAPFSNYGVKSVMLGAPGSNTLSTWHGESVNFTFPISDPLSLEWTTSSTTSGGWGYRAVPTTKERVPCLTDPPTYPSGTYGTGTDDRAWKALPIGKADSADLKFVLSGALPSSDTLRIAYKAGAAASDPFVDGKVIFSHSNFTLPDDDLLESAYMAVDVRDCISSPACTIGFQFASSAGSAAKGVAVGKVRVETFARNTTSYDTIYGTSMASPLVAGVVTMLRAHNPRYTYADVVEAVKAGGRPLPSLASTTLTGKAVDAIGTISYLQPITGVSATVQ